VFFSIGRFDSLIEEGIITINKKKPGQAGLYKQKNKVLI